MKAESNSTVVTAGDAAYSWGALLLVASMRRNGMKHPVVVGETDWADDMRRRILALGGVTLRPLPRSRQCVACQKPLLMACDDVRTEWVCWADADGIFIGDCGEWLAGGSEDEIDIRRYDPPPPDFTHANLDVWRRDVARICGRASDKSRYPTRMNTAFIVAHRKWRPFLARWRRQIENVLPADVAIVMKQGSPYFQTDESVLSSLLCFDPDAPAVTQNYRANGSADKNRFFAHFAYNPKPWQMWNAYSLRRHGDLFAVVDWLLAEGIVREGELPPSLRRRWQPLCRAAAPLAPWVWRARKLSRKLFRK